MMARRAASFLTESGSVSLVSGTNPFVMLESSPAAADVLMLIGADAPGASSPMSCTPEP